MKKETVFSALAKCLGYIGIFYGAQIIVSTFIGFIVGVLSAFRENFDPVTAVTRVTYELMILSGLVFLGIVFLMKRKNLSRELSLKKTPPSAVVSGAFLGFGAFFLAGILISIMSLIPAVTESQSAYMEQQEAMKAANPALWAEIFYVCLGAPIVEEILCRGLVLNTLKRSMRPASAILITGVIFAMIHGNLYQIVFTLPLGILLAWIVHRFDSIWPAILLHVCFNSSNYPAQICLHLGYGEEDTVTNIVYIATLLFCLIAIPAGILLTKYACSQKEPPEPVFIPEPTPPQTPGYVPPTFTPPVYTPPVYTPPYYNPQGGPMAAPEYMIVGLGNPGDKYAQNRHNVGFMALDYIAIRENVNINNMRFKALTGECVLAGKKVLLLKPQTFMNLSGEAVREAAAFYKIPPERILVLFDDINFQPGMFRIRTDGSAGGHNGIKSIITCLGTEAFPRVKIGVGTPPPQWELMNWVLGNPAPEDQKKILASLEDVYTTAKHFTAGNLDRAASLFNGKMHE